MGLVVALDFGTEGVRAGAFDQEARLVASATCPYATTYPRPGWAEQDPQEWWAATVGALGEVATQLAGRAVAGIGVATTASTVAVLDAEARPLRPAIVWMDSRAHDECAMTASVDHPVLRYSGGGDAVEWLVPKAMWLARKEPETYADAAHIVEMVDYITFRLTGRWTGSRMNAVCKWNYSLRDGGFSPDLYAELGVPDLCTKLPTDILAVGDAVGHVRPDVLSATGLTGWPIVAEGGVDAHMSLLSTGGLHSGDVSLVAGTSAVAVTEVDTPIFTPTIWGPYPDALLEGRWLIEGGQVSAGSILRWVAERMLRQDREQEPRLIADASDVPAGSNGVLVLDYFMGNRTPYRDPKLRGGVLGLTLASTAEDVYRAAVESVAYGTRNVLDSFVTAGVPVPAVTVSGGIARNPLWLQITADVLGAPLKLVAAENLTLRAGAACASAAAGLRADLRQASEAFTASAELIEPNTRVRDVYADGFGRYLAATEALTPVSHDLARAADGG